MNLTILRSQIRSRCGVDDKCQIWYRTNRFDVIQFSVNFGFLSAAILDFENGGFGTSGFWHFRCLGGVETKLRAKFGENQTNGSGAIQVLVNFKMAAGGVLEYEFRDSESTGFFQVRSR